MGRRNFSIKLLVPQMRKINSDTYLDMQNSNPIGIRLKYQKQNKKKITRQ